MPRSAWWSWWDQSGRYHCFHKRWASHEGNFCLVFCEGITTDASWAGMEVLFGMVHGGDVLLLGTCDVFIEQISHSLSYKLKILEWYAWTKVGYKTQWHALCRHLESCLTEGHLTWVGQCQSSDSHKSYSDYR